MLLCVIGVAPLKPLSISRMELQAALVGARLADSIIKTFPNRIIINRTGLILKQFFVG